jgi:DNA-binding transcriptional LysR family regulator
MQDLNDLRLFAAVVSHGGISAASRALGAPKSSVSRRIAALEGDLGVRLFERSTRSFRVTDVGRDVYQHARAALSEADAIEEAVTRLKAEPQGLVRISCPLGAERRLGKNLSEFLAEHPQLRLQFVVTNRRVDLIEEGVDIAIQWGDEVDADAGLQVRTVAHASQILVASPGLAKDRGLPDHPGALTGLPTLAAADLAGSTRWSLTHADGATIEVLHHPRMSVSDSALIRDCAIAGLGVALLPELVCRDALASGGLLQVLPDWRSRDGMAYLLFTSRRGLLPGVRAVIDFLTKALRPVDTPSAIEEPASQFQPRNSVSMGPRLVAAPATQ